MSDNPRLGIVEIIDLDPEGLKILVDSGARLECFAIPQFGHTLVVVTLLEDKVDFYNVGVVTSIGVLTNWREFQVETSVSDAYLGEDCEGFELFVQLHPSLESPY